MPGGGQVVDALWADVDGLRNSGTGTNLVGDCQSRRDAPIKAQGKSMRVQRALTQPWVQ